MSLKGRLIDLWLTPVGQLATVVIAAVVLFAPTHWLGFWPWVTPMIALGVGFLAGWTAARKNWRRRGYVPKL